MSVDTPTSIPQWVINILVWVFLLYTGIIGWFTRKYFVKTDTHTDQLGAIPSIYATIKMVNDMEDKLPGLVSRTELVSYMQQMRDEQLRLHKENLDNGMATRSDIRAVHERVDELFRNGNLR
jgi:hypothetical protein